MRSAIILSALFGATALAHPTLQNLHLHPKRDQQSQLGKPQLDRVWKDSNGVTHESYKVVEKIVLGQGQTAPTNDHDNDASAQAQAQPQAQPAPQQQQQHAPHGDDSHRGYQYQQKQAVQNHQDDHQDHQEYHQNQHQNPAPQQTQAPVKTSAPVQQPPPQQPQAPSDSGSGNSVLNTINKLRKEWDGSLQAYTWSPELEKNAEQTAKGSEQGGTQQLHTLNPGSFGQCIAPGKADDITSALKMWLCEIKKNLAGQCGNSNSDANIFARNDPLGHAKIFGNAGYTFIGCFFMGELWTCDFK